MKFIKVNAKSNHASSGFEDILLNVDHIVTVTNLGKDQIIIGTENEYNYFVVNLTLSEFIDRLKKIQQNINENIFIDFANPK
jgi:PHD/YefM family antitoxin component YafN of YafNO toxin-antitoxin module